MIERATKNDIPQLILLINSAYRGDASRKGWTTEADLISGELRTDEEAILELMANPRAVFLKLTEENRITGCVYLEQQNNNLYLGMLSVLPEMQGKNTGKKLLSASEEYAREKSLDSIVMNVISLRSELIAWYERRGYRKTGETSPFPAASKFGEPLRPLEFVVLKKEIKKFA